MWARSISLWLSVLLHAASAIVRTGNAFAGSAFIITDRRASRSTSLPPPLRIHGLRHPPAVAPPSAPPRSRSRRGGAAADGDADVPTLTLGPEAFTASLPTFAESEDEKAWWDRFEPLTGESQYLRLTNVTDGYGFRQVNGFTKMSRSDQGTNDGAGSE